MNKRFLNIKIGPIKIWITPKIIYQALKKTGLIIPKEFELIGYKFFSVGRLCIGIYSKDANKIRIIAMPKRMKGRKRL